MTDELKTWDYVERAALHDPVLHAAVTHVRQGHSTREEALIAAVLTFSFLQVDVREALLLAEHNDVKWLALDYQKRGDLLTKANEEIKRLRVERDADRAALQRIMQVLGPDGVPTDVDYSVPGNLSGLSYEVGEALSIVRERGIEYRR
jgi:hypothetical protein